MATDAEIMDTWMSEHPTNRITSSVKIPLSFEHFIAWLIKLGGDKRFEVDDDELLLSLLIYRDGQYLRFIISPFIESEQQYTTTLRKKININKFEQATKLKFTIYGYDIEYGDYERLVTVGEIVEHKFDAQLRKKYDTQNKAYRIKHNFEKNKMILNKKLKDLIVIFQFDGRLKRASVTNNLPTNIKESGEKGEITLDIYYVNASNGDFDKVFSYIRNKQDEIKIYLSDYTDLGVYAVNILNVNVVKVEMEDFRQSPKMRIFVNMNVEYIRHDDYYETIGYYKTAWQSICVDKHFVTLELTNILKTLNIDADVKHDDLCNLLQHKILKLQWSDFS